VLGLVEALDGEENASEVVGVDWDHEPWTRQASPEPRTKAFRPSVALIEGARQLWLKRTVALGSSDVCPVTTPRD
jgi:hypothetical protein